MAGVRKLAHGLAEGKKKKKDVRPSASAHLRFISAGSVAPPKQMCLWGEKASPRGERDASAKNNYNSFGSETV